MICVVESVYDMRRLAGNPQGILMRTWRVACFTRCLSRSWRRSLYRDRKLLCRFHDATRHASGRPTIRHGLLSGHCLRAHANGRRLVTPGARISGSFENCHGPRSSRRGPSLLAPGRCSSSSQCQLVVRN